MYKIRKTFFMTFTAIIIAFSLTSCGNTAKEGDVTVSSLRAASSSKVNQTDIIGTCIRDNSSDYVIFNSEIHTNFILRECIAKTVLILFNQTGHLK